MDTPGFDDTHLSDTEILKLYAFHFADLYERKVRLAGLLYLHRISDNRFGGSALKSLNILKMLCGGSAFSSTCLVTTFWSYVDTERGADREQELISNFWTSLLNGGARIFRHSGTTESAQRIVEMVLFAKQKSTVLAIQHEIVEKHLSLSETTVGMYLMADQEELKQKLAMKVEELKKEHAEAIQQKDAELSRELSEIRERYTEKIALAERSQSELEISWTNQRVQGDEQREIETSWTRLQGAKATTLASIGNSETTSLPRETSNQQRHGPDGCTYHISDSI